MWPGGGLLIGRLGLAGRALGFCDGLGFCRFCGGLVGRGYWLVRGLVVGRFGGAIGLGIGVLGGFRLGGGLGPPWGPCGAPFRGAFAPRRVAPSFSPTPVSFPPSPASPFLAPPSP